MAEYIYTIDAYDVGKLADEVREAGLPLDFIRGRDPSQGPAGVVIHTLRDLTTAEKTTLDAVVAAHDPRPRQKRTVYAILQDIGALTAAQQTAIWSDLSAGTPPKLALDAGPNAAAVFTMQFLGANVAGLTTAEKNDARRRVAAFYVQDNPKYLVHPAFDVTINIAGDEPVS